jgi:hypothetical protein
MESEMNCLVDSKCFLSFSILNKFTISAAHILEQPIFLKGKKNHLSLNPDTYFLYMNIKTEPKPKDIKTIM